MNSTHTDAEQLAPAGTCDKVIEAESVWEGSASEELCVQFRFGWIKLQTGRKIRNGMFLYTETLTNGGQ